MSESLNQFIAGHWIELAVAGMWQVLIVAITWKWDDKQGKTLAMVSLVVFPVAVLSIRNASDAKFALDVLNTKMDITMKGSKVGDLFVDIGIRNLAALPRSHTILAQAISELEKIAQGKESIANEVEYFKILEEELASTPDRGEIVDVVMPLNPARVQNPGKMPLIHYMATIKDAISRRHIRYKLFVLPSEKDSAAVEAALRKFLDVKVELYVVNRAELRDELRKTNFSLYETAQDVCIPNRSDDATIVDGIRIHGDQNELTAKRALLASIKLYSKQINSIEEWKNIKR